MALDYILFYFQFKVTATQVLTRLKSDAEIGFSRRFFFLLLKQTLIYILLLCMSVHLSHDLKVEQDRHACNMKHKKLEHERTYSCFSLDEMTNVIISCNIKAKLLLPS